MKVEYPFHLGPLSAWAVPLFVVLAAALVAYLSKYFPSKDEMTALRADMAKLDHAVREAIDKQEERALSRVEFNGFSSSMRERLDGYERRIAATEAECRASASLATGAHGDVKNLTQRLEDVIARAIEDLRAEVKELRRGRPG